MSYRFIGFWSGVVAICLGLLSCSEQGGQTPDTNELPAISLHVVSLNTELFACQTPQEVALFLEKHPTLARVFFTDLAQLPPSEQAAQLFRLIQNPELRLFRQEIDSLFEAEALANQLEAAFRRVAYYYPDFAPPKVQTLVTGFLGNDLYVSDSLVIIGLDYFGGAEARYRPDLFDYQLRRYVPQNVVPSVLFLLSESYNALDPSDRTLLADMVFFGKAYEFVKHTAPNTPDSLLLGFTGADINRTYQSQADLWAFFVSNRLLYETSELKKQKYVGERPLTPEIGPKVPGGIGRWMGWRIVSYYMAQQPDRSLPQLMEQTNAPRLLQESGYKGQLD